MENARRIILEFMEKTRLADRFPTITVASAVEAKVRETFKSWELNITDETAEEYIIVGLEMCYAAYQHTPHAVQIAMALFSICVAMLDDVVGTDIQSMREFVPSICRGKPQLHPLLTHFVECADMITQYLPNYTANMIHCGLMAYVNEELNVKDNGSQLVLKPDTSSYIEYSRYKSGVPEPYAASMWPRSICPDVNEYIQAFPWVSSHHTVWEAWSNWIVPRDALRFVDGVKYVLSVLTPSIEVLTTTTVINSDLMSYYKELLDSDEATYVTRYAQLNGKTVEAAAGDLSERLVSIIERIRNILGDGQAREAWEDFASGYVHFHIFCPRYRLKEVIPEYF